MGEASGAVITNVPVPAESVVFTLVVLTGAAVVGGSLDVTGVMVVPDPEPPRVIAHMPSPVTASAAAATATNQGAAERCRLGGTGGTAGTGNGSVVDRYDLSPASRP